MCSPHRDRSDAVVVRVSPGGHGYPLYRKERYCSQETCQDQDEQLPVEQQVVTVEVG